MGLTEVPMVIKLMKKLLTVFTEPPLKGDLKESPNMKVTHMEVIKKMNVVICTTHLLRIVVDTFNTLDMEMVVVEVEFIIVLPVVVMDTT